VIDVSDPAAPTELGAFDLPGQGEDVEVLEGLVYAAVGPSGLRVIDFGPEYRTRIGVDIDIRPRKERNRIHPTSRQIIPVAILGSEIFDVADVDVTTLAFGPAGASPAFDLTNPRVYFFSHRDVNGDGRKDLVSHYRSGETGIGAGDAQACLTGRTLDGTPFEGCDAITTLRNGRPPHGRRPRA
jgi:hypothetical protein